MDIFLVTSVLFNLTCIVYKTLMCYENLYSPHNTDSSSDKIDTKLYNKDTKFYVET